ncbi:MAG: uracil-DNA glycosylase family protein [Burkholderiaceae bacterium]
MAALLAQVRACALCADQLPMGPRPVLQMSARSRILIAAQAPGRKVHESGTPFDDASGDRLRDWLGIDRETFYDSARVAILPMGFCFPGTGQSGDLPPRRECAPAWRAPLLAHMKKLRLTVVIGRYALDYHLPAAKGSLTSAVQAWRSHGSDVIALPHPSGRNNIWLKRNRWFEEEVLPEVRQRVAQALAE